MLRAFSTAATGMTAQQMMVDIISNNLANINTTGFKRSQINFQDLVYVKMQESGTEIASGVVAPTGLEVGSGVRAASNVKVFSPGELENTGNNLDIAISGEGFLQVVMPNGELRYTRDGSLQINANGELVTSQGYIIQPANVTDSSGAQSVVGNIQLVRFPNPSGLSSEGDNLLAETIASGSPIAGIPGDGGLGTIQSGFLEKSNVQMVKELVNLITAQRAYEINSRAIRAGDDMLRTANEIAR